MAVGNHYKIVHTMTGLGMSFVNVYVYEQVTGDGNATNLATAFSTTVISPLQSILSEVVAMGTFEVTNFEDLSDFAFITLAGNGAQAGDSLPPFAAYAIRLNRATRGNRNGQKRYPGVTEARQNNGDLLTTPFNDLQDLADILASTISDSGSDFSPRIWRRRKPAKLSLPEVWPDSFHGVASATASGHVSSQNTRKFGRGI